MNKSILAAIAKKLVDILREIGVLRLEQQTVRVTPVPTVPTMPIPSAQKINSDLLHSFCMAVQIYEGYIIPGGKDGAGNIYNNGSPAYRNKNPGNLRCVYGDPTNRNILATRCTLDNFCVFPTYEIGFQALVNVTLNVAKGLSEVYNTEAIRQWGLKDAGEMNLYQYFTVRDPSSDGNFPNHFAEYAARTIGVDILTFKMKNLL